MKFLKSPQFLHWALFLGGVAAGLYETYQHGEPLTITAVLMTAASQWQKMMPSKAPAPAVEPPTP